MFYLETNAISNIFLPSCRRELINVSYTSSFAILETLKGLNQKNYNIKRKNIVSIKESEISIMWETPIDRIVQCFPIIENANLNLYLDRLQFLYSLVYDNENYEKAYRIFQNHAENDFSAIDKIYETYQKYIYEILKAKHLKETLIRISQDPLAFICGYMIRHIESLKKSSEFELDKMYLQLYNIYNAKVDIFLNITSRYIENYIDKIPDKNDLIDLFHFTYLENNTCKFVTNDKKLIKISNLERKIAYTCDEYIIQNMGRT